MARAPQVRIGLPPSVEPHALRNAALAAALMAIACFAAYSNSFHAEFQFDDSHAIQENQAIRSFTPISKWFNDPRPIASLSFALNYAMGALNPVGYHVLNLLIHILAGMCLYGIARRTLLIADAPAPERASHAHWTAIIIAMIWLLHPLQTQAVTYVVQRAESLMGLFYLLTLYCFIRGSQTTFHATWFALAIIASALGMATKAVMVTVPAVVLLYDRTFIAGSFRNALRSRPLFYLFMAGSWGVPAILGIFQSVVASEPGTVGFGANISPWRYLLTQSGVILLYIRLFFWPHPLCVDYTSWIIAHSIREVLLPGTVVAILLSTTAWALVRKPRIGFLAAIFFIILSPTSSFIPIQDPVFEHRMYLPLAPLVVLTIIAVRRLMRGIAPALQITPAALLAIILGVVTFTRNRVWASDLTLWSDAVTKTPASDRAHLNLGRAYYSRGRYDEAIPEYTKCLSIRPNQVLTENNLGGVLFQQGKIDEAIVHFTKAVKLNPKFAVAHNSLGSALVMQGKLEEAMTHYREAARLNPNDPDPHCNIAHVIVRRDDKANAEEAIRESREAIRLKPGLVDAHYNLANSLMMLSRFDEAIAEYQIVLKLNPAHPLARSRLDFAMRSRPAAP